MQTDNVRLGKVKNKLHHRDCARIFQGARIALTCFI